MKKLANLLLRPYRNIVDGIIRSTDATAVGHLELKLIAAVLAPMMSTAAFFGIYIGSVWGQSGAVTAIFTLTLLFASWTLGAIANTGWRLEWKMHLMSLCVMAAVFVSIFCFYMYVNMLIWLVLVIIALVLGLSSRRLMLNYVLVSFALSYWAAVGLFRIETIHVDAIYLQTLFLLLAFVFGAIALSSYLHSHLSKAKMQTHEDIQAQRDEITALYEENYASEQTLREQYDKLQEFNRRITESHEQLEDLAYNDTLTRLPNRKMILEQLEFLTSADADGAPTFSVVLIDLDNFKKVNDTLGHNAGDELLVRVSDKLREHVHRQDLAGRLGGDEFALLIRRSMHPEELLQYVQQLCDELDIFCELEGTSVKVSASFGIAVWPEDAGTATDLMKAADTALYKAKECGRNNVQFYHSDMKNEVIRKIELENRLHQAVKNEEFRLVYQPLFDGENHAFTGFEALLRWETPDRGFISPVVFIPLAEEIGRIGDIGEWVLRTACRKARELQSIYPKPFRIAINISPLQMKADDFMDMVRETLREEDLAPEYLEFEITESVFINSMERAVSIIRELQAFGIQVAMDDFGTGFSSLSYLMALPLDKLKIDRSFISAILERDDRKAIVRAIIEMAHSLEMKVVAEGVETDAQKDYLVQEKCDYLQGYLLSRPLPEDRLQGFLQELRS